MPAIALGRQKVETGDGEEDEEEDEEEERQDPASQRRPALAVQLNINISQKSRPLPLDPVFRGECISVPTPYLPCSSTHLCVVMLCRVFPLAC